MQKCDELSWEEFYYIYWPLVDSLGQKLGLREADCKDLMQEVMLDLFKDESLLHYDASRGKFRTFFGVLIRHKVSEMLQASVRSPVFFDDADNAGTSESEAGTNPRASSLAVALTLAKSPEENDPFQELFDEEYRNCLLSVAMKELRNTVEPKTYAIFEMIVLQHRSPKEVSRFLGTSRTLIDVCCFRCRIKLKKIVSEIRMDNPDFELPIPL